MGQKPHNDKDIVSPQQNYYDYDNDNVESEQENFNYSLYLKGKVLEKISEYRLDGIKDFLYGKNMMMSDCGAFINPAIKQLERFVYLWMNELDDETRKIIIWHSLNGAESDNRNYKDYNNTPLWKYISSIYKVQRNFYCSMCGKQYTPPYLVVHHLSYEHVGSELAHPEDVTVLCHECHLKVHNIGEHTDE